MNLSDAYNSAYKTYRFHYESDKWTTKEIAKALRDRIDSTPEFVDKKIIIVAHSMGGIVARHYMLQPIISGTKNVGLPSGERVEKLITLATLHHGTYGANKDSRVNRFSHDILGHVTSIYNAADKTYWYTRNRCDVCARRTWKVNRVSLLWDNFDGMLISYPDETPSDMPWYMPWAPNYPQGTNFYTDRIVAYSGKISPTDPNQDPEWENIRGNIGLLGIDKIESYLGKNYVGDFSDARNLAISAYLIDSIFWGRFNWRDIPDPENDGLVPFQSARFAGPHPMKGRVHCDGYNHADMHQGDVWPCTDGKMLFKSVRDEIISGSVTRPRVTATPFSLLTGPIKAVFGSQTYGVAASAGSSPIDTLGVQLSNLGDAPLQITSLSLAGVNPNQFCIVNPPTLPLTIGAESAVHIIVGFNPTSPGLKTAELRAENSSSNSIGVVNISATGVPEECDLDFSPASQFMPTSGGSGEVMVGNISCPWTVSAVDDWIHPTALADRFSFTADANPSTEVRYGTMIVSVYGRSYLYSISQDAANAPCWLQLSSDQLVVQREAGGSSFYITSPTTCGWNIQSDSPWLVPSMTSVQGSGTVGFTVADNSGLDRDGVITIQGAAMSAQFTVHQRGASISGTVTYCNAAAPPKYISNVTVTGTGSPNVSAITGAPGTTEGQYQLIGFGSGSYSVSLSKTTGQNGINSFDAARIAQHVTGISLLTSDNQRASADVTGNNAVSSQDAAKIAQYVANLPFSPPNLTGQWRFYLPPGPTFPVGSSPTSRTYSSVTSNITGDDYVGLLLGEVSGNWTNSGARPVGSRQKTMGSGPATGIDVKLPTLRSDAGKEIVMPVSVEGMADKGVISYEFNLRYDPSVMQPVGNGVDAKDTASRGLSFVTNATEPGLLRVVVYGAYPIDKDGVLLNLRFTAVGAAGSVSPLSFERIMFNEGEPGVMVTDGEVELRWWGMVCHYLGAGRSA